MACQNLEAHGKMTGSLAGSNQIGGQQTQPQQPSQQQQQQQQQQEQLPLDSESLLLPAPNNQQYPFYNIRRYRSYFDVDTNVGGSYQ